MTQDKFNELYIEFVDNFQEKYKALDLNFDMVMKMHGVGRLEFESKIAYMTDNPTDEMIEKWSTPTVEIEDKIKMENDLNDEGEVTTIDDNGNVKHSIDEGREKIIEGYEYGDLQKAVNNYLDDDDIYEDFVDERPEPSRDEDGGDDSNEY